MQRLRDLFELLDSDYNELISAQRIDISRLSVKTVELITPLLLAIEEYRRDLNFEQFVELAELKLAHLTVEERNFLLGPKRENAAGESWRGGSGPELGSLSDRTNLGPKEGRRKRPIESLIECWSKEEERKQQRIKGIVEQKERQEREACTFKPALSHHSVAKLSAVKIKSDLTIQDTMKLRTQRF